MTFYDDLLAAGHEHPDRVVLIERGPDRAVVTLNDPGKLNVLSAALTQQLKVALQELTADRAIRRWS